MYQTKHVGYRKIPSQNPIFDIPTNHYNPVALFM